MQVLKSRSFILPAIIISAIIAGVLFYYLSIPEKIIYPNTNNFNYIPYTDEANAGNSQILDYTVSDSVIRMTFDLRAGFFSPYVGIIISPVDGEFIQAKKYNQLNLQLKGRHIDRLGISLFNPPVDFIKNQDETLFHTFLNISNTKQTYRLPVRHFQTPEWWNDLHHIPETENLRPDMDSILHINIGSAYTPNTNEPLTLEVYAVSFSRDNSALIAILGLIEAACIIILFFINYLILLTKRNKPIAVVYKPLEMEEKTSPSEKFIQYINAHYSDSNLSLELVSRETGIPERQITKAIQSGFNCNFKTYINRIRLNESKRLLTETGLNIGEIAYKVGFNNQSHFNRVFKSEMQINPSEYRQKQRQ